MTRSLDELPDLPRDEDGPVFREPWEAQTFAMTVRLHEQGAFTWAEWADTLANTIKDAQASGDPDTGETYYRHWLTALETLVVSKGLIGEDERLARKSAWGRAARATPHGQPIELGRELRAINADG